MQVEARRKWRLKRRGGQKLVGGQRRNLGCVAKVLQHAASNKLFEGENEHLSSMNTYLSQTYQKFRYAKSLTDSYTVRSLL